MTPQDRLLKIVNHLADKESQFGSLSEDLACRDAIVKFVFPEYDCKYWTEDEEYQEVVQNELRYLYQEMGE